MTKTLSFSIVLVLLTISPVHIQAFDYCANYFLTTSYYDNTHNYFLSQIGEDTSFTTDPNIGSDLKNYATCSSVNLNKPTWNLAGTFMRCRTMNQFGLGIWINFGTTVSASPIMSVGTNTGIWTYSITSATEGTLTFTYIPGSAGDIDSRDIFNVDVPKNKWFPFVMHWPGNSSINVYVTGKAVVTRTPVNNYSFNPPFGYVYVGKGISAKIYQFFGFQKVTSWTSNTILTVSDGLSPFDIAESCSTWSCADPVCHPTLKCLSSASDCTTCDNFWCTACGTADHSAINFCNFIPVVCSSNCAACTTSTVCTQCNSGYFLYDNGGSTTCIECSSSCTSCNPGPACFECADSIVKDGTTCRVDKLGFQTSFSGNNIEIDFAHPLVSAVTLGTITAKSNTGSSISTTNWALNTCAAGATSCIIVTDNVSESQLPIELDFAFGKV